MASTVLVVDDERILTKYMLEPNEEYIYKRNSVEAVEFLDEHFASGGKLSTVYFDHDLGLNDEGKVDDTKPVVRALARILRLDPSFVTSAVVVHTQNSIASRWIYDTVRDDFDGIIVRLPQIKDVLMQDPEITRDDE